MTTATLFRSAGLANILAGLLLMAGQLFHPADTAANVGTQAWAIVHLILLASIILAIPGLFGLYWRQSRRVGTTGFIGFLMILVALVLFAGFVFFEAFINPVLAAETPAFVEKLFSPQPPGSLGTVLPVTGILFSLGWLLLGITTVRAGILPRSAAIVAIAGGIPFGVAPLLPAAISKIVSVVFGAGVIWLGWALWQEKESDTAQTPSLRPA